MSEIPQTTALMIMGIILIEGIGLSCAVADGSVIGAAMCGALMGFCIGVECFRRWGNRRIFVGRDPL